MNKQCGEETLKRVLCFTLKTFSYLVVVTFVCVVVIAFLDFVVATPKQLHPLMDSFIRDWPPQSSRFVDFAYREIREQSVVDKVSRAIHSYIFVHH